MHPLSRLDEKVLEESEAVHKSLLIFENLLDAQPERVSRLLVKETPLLGWLLNRLKVCAVERAQRTAEAEVV